MAADGLANTAIAERLGCACGCGEPLAQTVRRRRAGRADRKRTGRPRTFTAVVAQVKALACELPAASGTPLAKSCLEPARETAARGITASISASTVRRWLAEDVLKPWQHRSWTFPRDPYFAVKAARVFDLCEPIWGARPLGGDDYVLSADEKPGVQARRRIHPARPPGPGRRVRVQNEYARGGTLAYLAAPRAGDGPLRADDRHQAVHGPGGSGHER
jgi:hypothetical protein